MFFILFYNKKIYEIDINFLDLVVHTKFIFHTSRLIDIK